MARPKKNAVIAPKPLIEDTREAITAYGLKDFEYRKRRIKAGISLADQITRATFHQKNWYYPGGNKEFPFEPRLQCVDKYYPETEWGAVLVDEPIYPFEVHECERKRAYMKRVGYRYLVISPETDIEDCYRQLEEK